MRDGTQTRIDEAWERLTRAAGTSERRMVVYPSDRREMPERDPYGESIGTMQDGGIMIMYRLTD